jgi:hypothetical protein
MAVYVKRCERCGEPFVARRIDAKTCGGACRKAECIRSRPALRDIGSCPSCGDIDVVLDAFTGFCAPCTREHHQLGRAAA